MILLDKNSHDLLSYLLQLEAPETITYISRQIKQSRRMIYYHLDKINDALPDETPIIASVPRVGLLLTHEQKIACRQLLDNIDTYSYVMSMQERGQLLMLYIAIAYERVTLDKMIALADVSRNTVLNDLNDIRTWLSQTQYQVRLHVTKAKGYYFDCHPLTKIQLVYQLLYEVFSSGNRGFQLILQEKLDKEPSVAVYFSEEVATFIRQTINQFKEEWGKQVKLHDLEILNQVLPYLLLSYRNMDLNVEERVRVRAEFALARERLEYKIAQKLMKHLDTRFGIVSDDIEVALVATLLLSSRKDNDVHTDRKTYEDITVAVDAFLYQFECYSQMRLANKNEIAERLLIHCKALLFRKTYGIFTHNPLTNQIKTKYSEIFKLVKQCANVLEQAWLIVLNDADLAYLTIHVGSGLPTYDSNQTRVCKVCIVCDEGLAVQKLFLRQFCYYFPSVHIEAIFTTEQFRSVQDILDCELLILTSDHLELAEPHVVVSPILKDDDMIKLYLALKRVGTHRGERDFSQQLTFLLTEYIKDEETIYTLRSQIEQLISEHLLLAKEFPFS